MSGRGKKENNNKNFAAREAWMTKKKEGRPKQTWTLPNGDPALKKGCKGAVSWIVLEDID